MKTKVCEAKESRKEKRRGKGKKKKKKARWFPAWTTCPQIDLHPPGRIVLEVQRKTHVAQVQTTPFILFNYHSSSSDLH